MLAIISKPAADFEIVESSLHFKEIASSLSDVSPLYPHFKNWLYFTFRSGMYVNERKILVAHSNGDIAGLSLLKKTVAEHKICTFYVLPKYREEGIGRELMLRSLVALGYQDVGISVSEERSGELRPLLQSCGFSLEKTAASYYRPNKSEFFYKL